MPLKGLTFIELPVFTDQIARIADDYSYNRLQNELLNNPEKGALIPHLHGLRKIRMAVRGRGRQGGARVIYLYLAHRYLIFFFHAYTKAKSETLSPDQERRLKAAVIAIKEQFHDETDRN